MTSTIKCDRCLLKVPTDSVNNHLPDNGLFVVVDGYYGGFFDEPQFALEVKLCHDCSIKLLEMIPGPTSLLQPGLHASSKSSPCCSWSHSPAPGE